ncbi:MAG TPA: hypothetical protein VGH38_06975 [Bryobacteraceae bacterium]
MTFDTPLTSFRVVPCSVFLAGFLFHSAFCQSLAPRQDLTCQDGSGEYSTRLFTGTTVSVGPLLKGGFAERACTAKLEWGSQELTVASGVAQVAIDVLGADLGFDEPVVAFQIDNTGNETDRIYQIFSLRKTPHLLYTIKGGDIYSAADTDLDGQVEIWSDDASGIDGFEGVPAKFYDFAPTVVLRFQKKRLVDVSPEFQPHYDDQIAALRAQMNDQELAAFKNSDGVLGPNNSLRGDELHRLERTKIKVLEIVCAYLYSGREAEAWSALQEMWPSPDLARIRNGIVSVRQRGILRDINRSAQSSKRKHHAPIYDATTATSGNKSLDTLDPSGGAPDVSEQKPAIVPPEPILIRRPPPDEVENLRAKNTKLELVVDAAGKVRSVNVVNGTETPWTRVSAGWHFTPARRDGNPVACRFLLSVDIMR